MSEDPALQKVPELSLDEARWRAIAVAGPGEKSLELLGDDLVKGSLLCPARGVGGRGVPPGVTEASRDCDAERRPC